MKCNRVTVHLRGLNEYACERIILELFVMLGNGGRPVRVARELQDNDKEIEFALSLRSWSDLTSLIRTTG
jgi:hypothetical protein